MSMYHFDSGMRCSVLDRPRATQAAREFISNYAMLVVFQAGQMAGESADHRGRKTVDVKDVTYALDRINFQELVEVLNANDGWERFGDSRAIAALHQRNLQRALQRDIQRMEALAVLRSTQS